MDPATLDGMEPDAFLGTLSRDIILKIVAPGSVMTLCAHLTQAQTERLIERLAKALAEARA